MRTRNNLGLNQQIFDLGMPLPRIDESKLVRKKISELEENFDLVMLSERMSESLVLLAALLCVPLSDVVVLKVNARKSDAKVNNVSVFTCFFCCLFVSKLNLMVRPNWTLFLSSTVFNDE